MKKGILKQGNFRFPNNIQTLNVFRWIFATGVLFIAFHGMGQRNNVWLLFTSPIVSSNPNHAYCLDFNYNPPKYHYIFLEQDNYIRKFDTKYCSEVLQNSFCDTSGQFTFTEQIGQHFYNKNGTIYDSSYLQNKNDQFVHIFNTGSSVTAGNKTYYFKAFTKVSFNAGSEWRPGWLNHDSIFICVSEFTNSGILLAKNTVIYSLYNGTKISGGGSANLFRATKIDNENVEILFNLYGLYGNRLIHYNLNSKIITTKPPIGLDSISNIRYNTKKNILAVATEYQGISFYSRKSDINYTKIGYIDLNNYPAPIPYYKFLYVNDFCFSPNDSVLYVSAFFDKDTLRANKPIKPYLIIININKPNTEFRLIHLPINTFYVSRYNLKLGPDGNIYASGGGILKGNFRITNPNSIWLSKYEQLPDLDSKPNYHPNNSLWISTLEDYKKTEFSWQPTCKGLEVIFKNQCDTQFFKRYRLFFTDNDSVDLPRNWNEFKYTYKIGGKYYARLKAYSHGGGFIWYGDSVLIYTPPIAKFGIQKTKGCQWIGYQFNDSSKYFGIKPGFKPYKHWFTGDGNDTLDAINQPKLTYVYTQSNTYTVKLIVNNGYCTDTFIQTNNVLILPAPQPGMTASPLKGCTPLKVNYAYKYNDVLDSAVWTSGDLFTLSHKGTNGSFTYNEPGSFWLKQKLYGPSGCITKDSVRIDVALGISGMVDILNATVIDAKTIELIWKPHPNTARYSIFKNNTFLKHSMATSFKDTLANTRMVNSYTIKAISTCQDSTVAYDLARTVYLQGERTDNNQALLKWTPYEKWDMGVGNYKLYSQNANNAFVFLMNLNGQTVNFKDEKLEDTNQPQKCYKVIAEENQGNFQESASNIICIPLKPTLLISNAFSPNGDGINDSWGIQIKGIKEVKLRIFNRWGELIYTITSEKPQWDGMYKGIKVSDGSYFYHIEAIGIAGEKVFTSGLVEVVR